MAKTMMKIEDLLVIDEITQQSESMMNSITTGNFSNTPVVYEELFLTIAELMRGDFN